MARRPDAAPANPRRELVLRIVSAVALAPIAIAVAYFDGWPFVIFWTVAALGILWEWIRLVIGAEGRPALAAGAIALAGAVVAITSGLPIVSFAIIIGGAMLAAAVSPAGRRAWGGCGVLYAGAALVPSVLLRADTEHGFTAIIFIFAIVWVTDIAAYFAGRAIGGPKLAPRLSPKKTWSGALGGSLAAMVAGIATAAIAGLDHLTVIAVLSFALSVAAQSGDLAESAMKRAFGVKDSSQLIPGHGGLMDRLDGFIAAVLVAVIVGVVRADPAEAARGLLLW